MDQLVAWTIGYQMETTIVDKGSKCQPAGVRRRGIKESGEAQRDHSRVGKSP